MPSNSSVTGSLEAQSVPADRNCVTDGQSIVDLVQDYVRVVGLASQSSGSGLTTNNTASQALETANQALSQVQTLSGQIPQQRGTAQPQVLPAGDSPGALVWSTPMPDEFYEVRITFYGPQSGSAAYSWHVENNSRTVNGVAVRFINIPANFSFSWTVNQIIGPS